jgi:DNA-binding winged helix-turn-helix (wHTH) protein
VNDQQINRRHEISDGKQGKRLLEVGEGVFPVGGKKPAAILAALLIGVNRRVPVESLIDAAWGEQASSTAAATLETHIWRLRRALEPGRRGGEPSAVLVNDTGGYRLVLGPEELDSTRFALWAEDTRALLAAGRPGRALERIDAALALWRGRPYSPHADEAWAQPAVQLFIARARDADPALRIGADDAEVIARICAGLDGLPLAIELAAARVRAYSLEEIAEQVAGDPAALTPVSQIGGPRQSLRAAIDSSYRLLTVPEQELYRRLAVPPGPFTQAAAIAIADQGAAGPGVVDVLPMLVNRSLLTSTRSARPRGPSQFSQLVTVRAHAAPDPAGAERPPVRRGPPHPAHAHQRRPAKGHPGFPRLPAPAGRHHRPQHGPRDVPAAPSGADGEELTLPHSELTRAFSPNDRANHPAV